MKKIIPLLSLFLVLSSCSLVENNDENVIDTSNFNSVQKVLHKLTDNNFTVNFTSRLANNSMKELNVTYKYNPNYVMVSGDADNYNYMTKDDTLFKFSFDNSGEIVPSAPLISYTTGLRYESFYDYRIGFNDFNASEANLVLGNDGYYTYNFGQNETNDTIILMVLMGFSANTHIYPNSFKMKAIGDSLICDVVGLIYEEDIKDTYTIVVNNIGTTENAKVEEFLNDDTKGPYEPLDTRFSKLIFPYLTTYNYSISIDGSNASDANLKQFVGTYEFDENVLAYISPLGGNYSGGYVEYLGYVHKFLFDGDDKITISSTPTDSDGNFYTSIFGEIMFPFAALDLSMFRGYKIDEDNYVITSDECIYYLAQTFNFQINDGTYVDAINVHIDDYSKKEFTLSMNVRNKTTKIELGELKASYFGLNSTNVKGLNRLLNEGKEAKIEDKAEFEEIMNEFRNGEYMFDVMSSNGLAHKYYTKNYVFTEVVGNKANNYGYIKIDDHIYEFYIDYTFVKEGKVVVDTKKDYATFGMKLPGAGTFWGNDDDAGYISHFKGYEESLYDYENYVVAKSKNTNFWKFNVPGAATKLLNYFGGDEDVTIPTSCGFTVSTGLDSYDKRVALRINYTVAENGYEGYQIMTFYNLNNAKYDILETYLASL